jgi:ribonuclease BN (tRNA processing enzyme)
MTGPVQLVFLGCGDAFAAGGRLNTCFYVEAPSSRFLIDCGASSLAAMHRYGITSDAIDAVFISHFHGDHYGGLPFLFLDAAKQRGRERPLTVVTPPGGEARTRELMECLYPGTSDTMDALDLRFVDYSAGQALDVGGVTVTAFPVVHAEGARPHGLRLAVDGRTIGFSGDTAWTESLIDIAVGTDVMICECNFFDTQTPAHLDYRTLARRAPELRTDRLVLNHLGSEVLGHLDRIEHTCAHDGMTIAL